MHACDVLRERTATAHAALERSNLIIPATRERERFALLVGGLLSFNLVVETELERFARPLLDDGIDVAAYAKSANLRDDAAELRSPAVERPRYRLRSDGEAAGALYVMEGSTLGGMLIANDVRRNLAFTSRYYGCYGRETATRWRETRERLDRFARTHDALDAMVAGADATFLTLHRHLESLGRHAYAGTRERSA